MQLPSGTTVKNFRGPKKLTEVGLEIEKENLTGYLRVSLFRDGRIKDGIIVVSSGKPVMSYVSDGEHETGDPGFAMITGLTGDENAVIEICRLAEKQVQLLQEFYKEFVIAPQPWTPQETRPPVQQERLRQVVQSRPTAPIPGQPQASVPVKAPDLAASQPVKKAIIPPVAKYQSPNIRGKFVRSAEIEDMGQYVSACSGMTGHLLFIARTGTDGEEYHLIINKGVIEATYNDTGIVQGLPAGLYGMGGLVEYYAVDEAILVSVLGGYLKKEPVTGPVKPQKTEPPSVWQARPETPATAQLRTQDMPVVPERQPVNSRLVVPVIEKKAAATPRVPAPGPMLHEQKKTAPVADIGIPARVVIQKSISPGAKPVEDDISKTLDDLSNSMDDDIAMVRRVELDFASHVNELLEKLELGHLRNPKAKP